jgi:hypothetical protein
MAVTVAPLNDEPELSRFCSLCPPSLALLKAVESPAAGGTLPGLVPSKTLRNAAPFGIQRGVIRT